MVRNLYIEWKRRIIIAGIVAGVLLGYRYLLPVAVPFLAAWLFASWIYPLAFRLEKKIKIKKTIIGAIILSFLLAAVGVFLYWCFSELLSQTKVALSHYNTLRHWSFGFVDDCCNMFEEVTGVAAAKSRQYILEQTKTLQSKIVQEAGPFLMNNVVTSVKGMLLWLSGIVVTFIMAVLAIGEMEAIRKKTREYHWLAGTRRVICKLKKTVITYLKAQLVIIGIVAAVCAFGFWLLKSPYFLILGLILGVMDALPLIGTGIFLYPAAVFFIIKGDPLTAVGCVAIDVATSLLREFLEPHLLGGKLGISPIVILASVYLGFWAYGAWGVILGPLSFSTIYEIGKEWDIWD